MAKQVAVIHGGNTFDSYEQYLAALRDETFAVEDFLPRRGWKTELPGELGERYQVLAPNMPNKQNAKYHEWVIRFEKLIPVLTDEVILIGHSLGGLFLAKYLSNNRMPVCIQATFLVGAVYDKDNESSKSLADFALGPELNLFAEQGGFIHLYHSVDDSVVPFSNLERYREKLPRAFVHIFGDRGHFTQESFPELVEEIRLL